MKALILRVIILLTAISLSIQPAHSQTFWYKRNVITLYREGWLGTWINLEKIEDNIKAVYWQNLDATIPNDEKNAEVEKTVNMYKEDRLEEYLTTVTLPILEKLATEQELDSLINWLDKEKDIKNNPIYLSYEQKTKGQDLVQFLTHGLLRHIYQIAEGKRKNATPLSCSPSYKATFDQIIAPEEWKQIMSKLDDALISLQHYYHTQNVGGKQKAQKTINFVKENARTLSLNMLVKNGITEEELTLSQTMECYRRIANHLLIADKNTLQRNAIQDFAQWHKTYHTSSVLDQPEKYLSLVVMLLNSDRERTVSAFENMRFTYEDLALRSLKESIDPQVKRLTTSARQKRAEALVDRYLKEQLTTDLANVYTPYLKENLNGNKLSRYLSGFRTEAVQKATLHENQASNDSTTSMLVAEVFEQLTEGKTPRKPQLTECSDSYKKLFDYYYQVSHQAEAVKQVMQTLYPLMGVLNMADGMSDEISEEDRKEIETAKLIMTNGGKYLEENWYVLRRNSFVNHMTEQDLETLIEFGDKSLTRQVRLSMQNLAKNQMAVGFQLVMLFNKWLSTQ